MIASKNRIEDAFNAVSTKNLIFNKKRPAYTWLTRFLFLSMTVPLCLMGLSIIIDPNINIWMMLLALSGSSVAALGLFAAVNHHAKKRLLELGISPLPGIFTEWANTEYYEFRLKKLYRKLCSDRLLTKTALDIDILADYKKLFEGESTQFYRPGFILGGVFVAFLIPLWSHYLNLFFKKNESSIENITFVCSLIASLVILCFVILEFFRFNFDETRNRKSIRYKNISKDLELLRLSLRLKYKK